jgi:hypothetical protein
MVNRKHDEHEQRERMKVSAARKQDSNEPERDPSILPNEKEEWIGRQLRQVYDKALSEPIPERFLDLLKQIDEKDPESK